MTITLAVANQKGGVAKTTTVACLGTARSTPGAQAYRHIAEGLHIAADRMRMERTR